MGKIEVEVKEHKGPLGFGKSYTAQISERGDGIGVLIPQTRATNVTAEWALEDAMEEFNENKEKGK